MGPKTPFLARTPNPATSDSKIADPSQHRLPRIMVSWAGPSRTLPISMVDGRYLAHGTLIDRDHGRSRRSTRAILLRKGALRAPKAGPACGW